MLDREPATHNWAAGFAAVPRAELVAVYDRADTTRQTFVDCWGAMPAFDDYAAMLVAIQPDIVCRKYLEAGRWARRQAGGHTGDVGDHPDTEGGPRGDQDSTPAGSAQRSAVAR